MPPIFYSTQKSTIWDGINRGSPRSSQISHLLLYHSLWLLVPGLSSHYFLYNKLLMYVSNGHVLLQKMATRFCEFEEPLRTNYFTHDIVLQGTIDDYSGKLIRNHLSC